MREVRAYMEAAREKSSCSLRKMQIPLLEQAEEEKMKAEDLTLIAQLVNSMELAYLKLEKAFEKKNVERIREAKEEVLKFQKQINGLID